MRPPAQYDLLVILAGEKPVRHPPAAELLRRGWARRAAVTGEHERIEATTALPNDVIAIPPTTSTYEDAVAVRALVLRHRLETVLVVTSASHADRAWAALRRAMAGIPVEIDILTWEPVVGKHSRPRRTASMLVVQALELLKLAYLAARRRA